MVIVTEFHCSIQTYLALCQTIIFQRPTRCPGCGAEHSFIGHGFYPRKPLDTQQAYLIWIKRWFCTACEHTLSLLPSFLLRFRHYLLDIIQAVVIARYEEASVWRQVAERCAPQGAPSLRTVKRWCQSFAAQASTWLSEIEQTLAQHDPATSLLDANGQNAGPVDLPCALLAGSLHLLAWAKTRWTELTDYGLTDRLRFLWHWGHARGLNRLV
jgi:transposase-like protein